MTDPMGVPRLGVLLSGRGSNFLALHGAIESGKLPATIVAVGSDRPGSQGLVEARRLGLPVWAQASRSRRERERGLLDFLLERRVDWVCLAGYLRLLSAQFVSSFPHRIVNMHPSLLPAFPGLHAARQAIEHGVRVSGCTVHLVDAGLDSGPIVEQRAVEVVDGDTEERLSARILAQEHLAYPRALRRLLGEAWRVEGRRVFFG